MYVRSEYGMFIGVMIVRCFVIVFQLYFLMFFVERSFEYGDRSVVIIIVFGSEWILLGVFCFVD